MGSTIVAEKHRHGAPDLVMRPNIGIFRMLDFYQASAILRAAEPIKPGSEGRLGGLISAAPEKIPQQRRRFALAMPP